MSSTVGAAHAHPLSADASGGAGGARTPLGKALGDPLGEGPLGGGSLAGGPTKRPWAGARGPADADVGDIRAILGKRERALRPPGAERARPRAGVGAAALLEATLAAVEAATGSSVRTSDGPSPRELAARVARVVVLAAERGRTRDALALGDEDTVRCELAARASLRERALGRVSPES